MSLNHLISQDKENKYLNPRFESLVIDDLKGNSNTIIQTGTWIPTIGDNAGVNFVTSTASGRYTRIGKLVFAQAVIVWTSKGLANNGLPLAISIPLAFDNTYDNGSAGSINFNSGITFPVGATQIESFLKIGDNALTTGFQFLNAGLPFTRVFCSDASVAGQIILGMVYNIA